MALSESSLIRMAEFLLAKLDSSSIQQSSLDIDVSYELREFKETLSSLKDRVLGFDHNQEQEDPQRWLWMLKEVLFEAENMLDDIHFESSLARIRRRKQPWLKAHIIAITKVGSLFPSSSCSSSSSNALPPPTMATQIDDITERLQHCAVVKVDVDTRFLYTKTMFPNVKESDVIGREVDKERIIEKLLMQHHHHDDQSLPVLPIVGMGGLGKSTLAKIVLLDKRILKSFLVQIWVCVSHDFDIEQVIVQMINSVCFYDNTYRPINKGQLNMTQLLECLRKKLVGQKFLLVLDDVREENPGEWDELINIIPKDADGSKILLTTRSYSIAFMTGTIPSYNLQPLSLKDSLSLFEKCATKRQAEKYLNLIEFWRETVNQCGGIPLAIKTMGSMVFSNFGMVEWKSLSDKEFRDMPKEHGIFSALRLSYHYMPFHLKQCFELLSLYPNEFVFHSSEVVSLWAALDLLPSPNIGETLTDVSQQCLQELLPRFFFKEFINFGTSYYFQIHDSVHDLARDMARFECEMVNFNNLDIAKNARHLSFAINNLFDRIFTPKYADVRTILFPIEGEGATSEDFLNKCVSRYKYLRILDLSDSTYKILPRSIGKLRHLRFLSLERNKIIERIPNSICKLQNLQVLNLVGCMKLKKFPKGLSNLAGLRQLGITIKESTLPQNDIANLDSLEILHIESCEKLEFFCVGIKLPTLKTLEVTNCRSLKYLPLDIDHFPQLETLLVDSCGSLELAMGLDDQNFNLQLKAIHLHSLPQMVNLPHWLQKSTNMLQSLLIVDCKNFEMLPEWISTFNVLGSFGMVNCPKLMSLPNNIHHLTALQYLRIEGCPKLCRKCQPRVGEYWTKIYHIKRIIIGEPEDLEQEEELEEDERKKRKL